jgi:hypothetical protein
MAYDQQVDGETSFRIWAARFWEMGHSYEEIMNVPLDFLGDIIGYFSEKNRAEESERKRAGRLH